MARILVIDDDLAMDILIEQLRYRGHDAARISSAETALKRIDEISHSELVILDIIMPWPESRERSGIKGPLIAGMEILIEIKKRQTDLPIIVYSGIQDGAIKQALKEQPNCTFISKWGGEKLEEIVSIVQRTLGIDPKPIPQRPFIVHGHDETAKLALKNFLQNSLHLPEPIILHEQPNLGRTLIEKFEAYAIASQIIFVLLTPDDIWASASDPDDVKRRARQNVIFEMGFFLGVLGRESGRIILLYKSPLDLPTDISGLAYIDISKGIDAAGEQIRRELEHVNY
jgi:CheY-like chemotaxis protein